MAYTLPQLKVHQDFTLAPRDITRSLNPCVMGPRCEILSYDDSETRGLCSNKPYSGSEVTVPWSASGVSTDTDKTWGRVTLANAHVCYNGTAHSGGVSGTPQDKAPGTNKATKFRFTLAAGKSLDARGGNAPMFNVAVVAGDYVGYAVDGGVAYVKIKTVTSDTITLTEEIEVSGADETFDFVRVFETLSAPAGKVEYTSSGAVLASDISVALGAGQCPVVEATAYLTQRNFIASGSNRLGTVASDSDITAYCGPIVPENPIAYGLHCTLRNCASAEVRYMIVESDNVTGWTKALAMATNTNEVYAISALTKDRECLDLVEDHCDKMSAAEQKSWRIAFVSDIPDRDISATSTEWANAIATRSSHYRNKRIYNVAPGTARDFDGNEVDGMFLAAAVCGLACSVLPQQPITNVALEGFADIPDTYSVFSRSDLNIMAGGGTLIVMQDRPDGVVYVRHQISTDYASDNINTTELSIVRNIDSISYYFANRFAPYIGRYNVTEELLAELTAVLKDGLSYLKTATEGNRLIGPQILAEGSEIRNIYQDPNSKDHVIANVALNLPAPFNNFDLYLQVI